MTHRRVIVWIVLAALLLAIPLGLYWLAQPERVAGVILGRLGDSLGLEITASGDSSYGLRGTPELVVRDIVVRQPGADTPLLLAERIRLSLPWSTILSRGEDMVAQRLEIDAPRLDIDALQRWRETRPPSAETRIPTLEDGLRIVRGSVIGSGWTLDGFDLSLPSFAPGEPIAAAASGRLQAGTTAVPFDLQIALTTPAFDAALGVAGMVTVVTPDWRLPMRLKLGGRLHDGDDGMGLDHLKMGAHARLVEGDSQSPFVYGLAGRLRYHEDRVSIEPLGLVIRGQDSIPTLDASGAFAWQQDLALDLDGTLPRWPDTWPALPPPIGQSDSQLPFQLRYRGPADLSGDTALQLRRDATRFDARFRLPDVLAWIDAAADGTPLPPIDGSLTTPKLEITGATLHGVEIQFEDGAEPGDE
ncbi:MAG: hypothetical protein M3Q42_06675 [Pseudomonadota bacterium]|nr:hypothetical protein [Pseudomonadota bacterium]